MLSAAEAGSRVHSARYPTQVGGLMNSAPPGLRNARLMRHDHKANDP